jgi:hypothetical protein
MLPMARDVSATSYGWLRRRVDPGVGRGLSTGFNSPVWKELWRRNDLADAYLRSCDGGGLALSYSGIFRIECVDWSTTLLDFIHRRVFRAADFSYRGEIRLLFKPEYPHGLETTRSFEQLPGPGYLRDPQHARGLPWVAAFLQPPSDYAIHRHFALRPRQDRGYADWIAEMVNLRSHARLLRLATAAAKTDRAPEATGEEIRVEAYKRDVVFIDEDGLFLNSEEPYVEHDDYPEDEELSLTPDSEKAEDEEVGEEASENSDDDSDEEEIRPVINLPPGSAWFTSQPELPSQDGGSHLDPAAQNGNRYQRHEHTESEEHSPSVAQNPRYSSERPTFDLGDNHNAEPPRISVSHIPVLFRSPP